MTCTDTWETAFLGAWGQFWESIWSSLAPSYVLLDWASKHGQAEGHVLLPLRFNEKVVASQTVVTIDAIIYYHPNALMLATMIVFVLSVLLVFDECYIYIPHDA